MLGIFACARHRPIIPLSPALQGFVFENPGSVGVLKGRCAADSCALVSPLVGTCTVKAAFYSIYPVQLVLKCWTRSFQLR